MAKKLSELEEEKAYQISSEVEAKASVIGADIYISPSIKGVRKPYEKFGLCQDCIHFRIALSNVKVKAVKCQAFEHIELSESDPITECNYYTKRTFQPSLHDMMQIAIILEPYKRRIGFENEENN